MFKHPRRSGIYISVQRIVVILIFALSGVWTGFAAAHTRASLVLSASAVKPGDTVLAAVRMEMESGWHTYWKNPGGAGIATKIKWQLPKGVSAGAIQWPVPEKFLSAKIDDNGLSVPGEFDFAQTTYGYKGEATLLVPLTFAPDLASGPLEIKASVEWLECKVQCLPGRTEVAAQIEVAAATSPGPQAGLFTGWQNAQPKPGDGLAPKASWRTTGDTKTRELVIEWNSASVATEPDFFPEAGSNAEVSHQTTVEMEGGNTLIIRKLVTSTDGKWPAEISGLLIHRVGGKSQGFSATLQISDPDKKAASAPAAEPTRAQEQKPLWHWLAYAFLGGLILNVMPCVLPVIALKILGFVSQAKESPGSVRKLGLLYAAGVLMSFLTLALIVIGVKAAGHKAGWGMQFSNPYFVVGMTALVTLVALNLFGVFEVTISGRVMSTAGGLASRHGSTGAFFNGALATLLATPCTAPFLAPALGFAFAQPSIIIIAMFLTTATGLAAPYVLLSWQPMWLKFLPKPGAWMEKFKIAMGFPMLATAIWLGSLATSFYGDRSWWLGVFLIFVAAAAWVFGEFGQRAGRNRIALAVSLFLLGIGYRWPLESGLQWRKATGDSRDTSTLQHAPKGYAWQTWSVNAVAAARAKNRAVIVDFTAKWCQTCNISVKPALESAAVIEKLQSLDAIAMIADYTTFAPEITAELEKFERSGVPMVLVYPADPLKPPVVLPDPLPYPLPYAPVVLKALDGLK